MSEDTEYFKNEIYHVIDEVLEGYIEKNTISGIRIVYFESTHTFTIRFFFSTYTLPHRNFTRMTLAPNKVYTRPDPSIKESYEEPSEEAWNTVKEILQKLEKKTALCRLALGRS